MKLIALLSVGLLGLTACNQAPDSEEATSCTGDVYWSAGSMEVPYTYNWTFTWSDEGASFELDSDTHDADPLYSSTPEPSAQQIEQLCTELANIPADTREGVGGQYLRWATSVSEGSTTITADISTAAETVREIVGPENYDEAIQTWENFRDTYERPTP